MRKHPARLLLATVLLAALPLVSQAFVTVGVSITVAPPPLPVYEQPPIPEVGYMWAPGYWAWDGEDYYWVPGTWVLAPEPGLLWTPGYWGWVDGSYLWHEGYWGRHVGFYGGVDYGYGYPGEGFVGGEWRGDQFYYNRAVENLGSAHITNVYNRTVVNNITVNRVSYNGGEGGTRARPTREQLAAEQDHHISPTSVQHQQERLARSNPELRRTANQGHPPIAATARPADFSGRSVIAARGAGPERRAERSDRPPSALREGGSALPQREHAPTAPREDMRRNDRPPQAAFSERRAPERSVPERSYSERSAPQRSYPERSAPERSIPERSYSERSAPQRSYSERSAPERSVPERSIPEHSMPERGIERPAPAVREAPREAPPREASRPEPARQERPHENGRSREEPR